MGFITLFWNRVWRLRHPWRSWHHMAYMTAFCMVAPGTMLALATVNARAATPPEIRVDYAYYSPESLVIKRYGWLENEFRADQMGAEPGQQSRARIPE